MDPYLERHWPTVHVGLIERSSESLTERLPDDLVARPEELVAVGGTSDNDDDDEDDLQSRRPFTPDLRVAHAAGVAGARSPSHGRQPALGTLRLRPAAASTPKRREVRITELDGGRLVTTIEFVSPSNKRGRDRVRFLRKRRRMLAAGVNAVEIDLTRAGPWRRLFNDVELPPRASTTYRVAIFVPGPRGGLTTWLRPFSLPDALPAVKVPLRRDEEPVEFDLRPLIDAIYRVRRFWLDIDYAAPCDPPLKGDDAEFARQLLAARSAS